MAILTVQEVQDEAIIRGIDLTDYTDEMITRKISVAQAYIEEYTGRTFDTTIIIEEPHYRNKGDTIILDKSPVISIEKILIDDSEYSLTEIEVDYEAGIIYLQTPSIGTVYPRITFNLNQEYDALVDYTVSESVTSKIFLVISEICLDLFFINLDRPVDGQDIKSFKDSDFSVTYEDMDPTDGIDKRLNPFRKIIVGMI